MSNPLLQPSDDRFHRPKISGDGTNPFQEQAGALKNAQLASPPQVEEKLYETVYPHRGGFLALLAGSGLAFQLSLLLMFYSFSVYWIMLAMSGVMPGLIAVFLAKEDIAAMRAGAMDPSGLGMTRAAFWLGICASLTSLITVPTLVAIVLLFI